MAEPQQNLTPSFVNYLERKWWTGPGQTLPEAYTYVEPGALPLQSAESDDTESVCAVKLFTPDSSWTAYLIDWDPGDKIAFALVEHHFVEFGSVDLEEIARARGPLGLPIERDTHWTPRVANELRAELIEKRGGQP